MLNVEGEPALIAQSLTWRGAVVGLSWNCHCCWLSRSVSGLVWCGAGASSKASSGFRYSMQQEVFEPVDVDDDLDVSLHHIYRSDSLRLLSYVNWPVWTSNYNLNLPPHVTLCHTAVFTGFAIKITLQYCCIPLVKLSNFDWARRPVDQLVCYSLSVSVLFIEGEAPSSRNLSSHF